MKQKTLIVSEETHSKIKKYCKDNSLKMMDWVDKCINEYVENIDGASKNRNK